MNKLELTPAESYLLLNIENKDGKTLMKYSLINLLYKNVLSSEVREETEGSVFKQVVKKTYLSKGSQFGKLNLKAHEKLLCSVIADEEDEIELVEFIKKIPFGVHRVAGVDPDIQAFELQRGTEGQGVQ